MGTQDGAGSTHRTGIELSTFDQSTLKIIDAHHHFWDLENSGIHYPWLHNKEPEAFFLGDYTQLRQNYLPDDHLRNAGQHLIEKTVHVEAECSRDEQVAETQWLNELHAKTGLPNAIVAHAWFHTANAAAVLEEQASYSLVRGIRSKPVTRSSPEATLASHEGTMQDPAWVAGLKRLRQHNLSWDLRVPAWHLLEAAEILRQIPDTPVVLNHTGFPWNRSEDGLAMWRRGMRALAEHPTCFCKLSCLCLPDGPWNYDSNRALVLETIDLFGAERCMFASNFPVDGLRVDMNTMWRDYKRIVGDFSPADQQRLFYGSAAAFYRV